MHDPFQSYQTMGAFATGATPFGLPYGSPQVSAVNPMLAGNPLAGLCGVGGYGIHPQQQQIQQLQQIQQQMQQLQQLHQQLQQQLQSQGIPGQHNPMFQHPLAQGWQNPLAGIGLQTPFQNPLAQQGWPQQQFGYPQQQYGYPLAPQTLIGGYGQGYGQIHPLAAQLAMRSISGGMSPWGC